MLYNLEYPTNQPTTMPTFFMEPMCYEVGSTFWSNSTYWAGGYAAWNGTKMTHACQSIKVTREGGYDLRLTVIVNLHFTTKHPNAYPVDFMVLVDIFLCNYEQIGIWNPSGEGVQVGGYDVYFDASWPLVPRTTSEVNQTKWLDPQFFTYTQDTIIRAKVNTTVMAAQPSGNWTVCVANGYRDTMVSAQYEADISLYSCPGTPFKKFESKLFACFPSPIFTMILILPCPKRCNVLNLFRFFDYNMYRGADKN